MSTTRIAFVGLVVAACGALLGVTGWAIGQRLLWVGGFVIGLIGWAVGLIGIVYGWVTGGRRAIAEGYSGTVSVLGRFWSRVLRHK